MREELFDVVNQADQVVSQRPRKEVHRLGLKHRATHILLFNSQGEVFLQKRSQTKDTHPGVWDSSASGHLDTGEAYDDCACRELFEELGCRLNVPLRRWLRIDACVETGQEFLWVYRGQCEGPFRLHPEEIEEGAWFSPDHVTRWIKERPEDFAPAFRLIWNLLGKELAGAVP